MWGVILPRALVGPAFTALDMLEPLGLQPITRAVR